MASSPDHRFHRLSWILACMGLIAGMAAGSARAASPALRVAADGSTAVAPEVRQPDAPPVYAVPAAREAPKIDGRLDDAAWQQARPFGRFYLDSGDGPMLYETIARMVRDDTYLYVGVDCRHPKIAEVPVRKGARDHVSWAGETVELFLDTDRGAADYVQVIFDMSGAFTDTFAGVPSWDGDITAATAVGEAGWTLEVRLKIADLGGPGRIDRHIWGANIARSSGDDSASWARLLGSYQQPDYFGLLTFGDGAVAVEDIGLGVFALPGETAAVIPVRLALRNLGDSPREYVITSKPIADKDLAASGTTVNVPAGSVLSVVLPCRAAADGALDIRLCAAGDAEHTLFQAVLPVRPDKAGGDCLVSENLTWALRPVSPVAISKEQAAVYLMARSLQSKPLKRSGKISLLSGSGKVVWQSPVELLLSQGEMACQRVDLPAEIMQDGQYRLEWSLAGQRKPNVVRSEMVYSSLGMDGVRRLLAGGRLDSVLASLKCPLPKDAADRAIVQVWIDRLSESLQRQAEQKELDLSAEILRAYRMLMQITTALRDGQPYIARQRGWFETAFYSPVDDSAQPYSVFVPLDYDKHSERRYPLVVYLHGRGGTHGGESGFVPGKDSEVTDRLMMNVLGRGRAAGYGSITADEVVREIAEVMARYRIDPDAVHIWGQSMGGFGTFTVASMYPDLFATARPYCGGAFGPVDQMLNVPTFIHHGLADETVPVHCSIRAAQQMQRAGCPVQLYCHPQVGHDVTPSAEKVARWETIRDIRRDAQPATVVLTGGLLPLAKAYWLSIVRYEDIHQPARVRATFAGMNHLQVEAGNVTWLKIALPCRWIDPKRPVQISDASGLRWTEVATGDAKALYVNLAGQVIRTTTEAPVGPDDTAAYTGGGAANLFFLGRPVRIVYGTAGSAEQTEALAKLAGETRRWNPFSWGPLETGGYPVLKDSEVSEQTLRTCDLVLLGTPADNSLLARMAEMLPVKFEQDRVRVEAEPAMSWAAGEVVLSLYYRNPLSPDRRIWWFAGQPDRKTLGGTADITRNRTFGEFGPELVVQAKDSMRVIATAHLQEDWRLVRTAGKSAKEAWQTPADLDRLYNQFVKDAMPVDISVLIYFSRSDVYDWEKLTAGEVLSALTARDLMILPVKGKHLLDWRDKAKKIAEGRGEKLEVVWAGVPVEKVEPEAIYDVLLQPESMIMGTMEVAGVPIEGWRLVPAREVEAVRARFLRGTAATSTVAIRAGS